MASKVTWDTIYRDFKSKYPRLSKEAIYFKPHDYLTIKIWFKVKPEIMTYDYMTKQCIIVKN